MIILDRQQFPSLDNTKALEAIGKLNRSLQSQTLVAAQYTSLIDQEKINRLIRRLDTVPDRWEQILINPKRSKMMRVAIEHYSLSWNRYNRDPKLLARDIKINSVSDAIFSPLLKYHHLIKPATRFIAADLYQIAKQDLAYWVKQNVCRTDGNSGLYSYADNKYIAEVGIGNLELEITTGVRQIKSQLGAGQSIDKVASEFKLASQTCPGERWTAKTKDGAVAISFSHPPNWKALGMEEQENIDRFNYNPHSASPSDRKIIKTKPLDRSDCILNNVKLLRMNSCSAKRG